MPQKINLLLLNYEFPPLGGGAANATYYMLKEFAGNPALRVEFITSSVAENRSEQFADNINIHYLDIGKGGNMHYQSNADLLNYARKAFAFSRKLMKKQRFDVIHAFFGIPCGFIARFLKLPYIVSLRGSDVPFYNERFKTLDKLLFKRLSVNIWKNAAAVYANSQGLRDLALQSAPRQPIGVIYNGVNVEEFCPIGEVTNNAKLTIISTGRLIARKGYDYLIKALKGLNNVKLQLIGNGNVKEELQSLATKNGVELTFWGKLKHEQIARKLQSADLFVLPSLNEGMSNALLEALACGLPVIATDTGGTRELVTENNGFVVPKADVFALRNAIEQYRQNPDLLPKHGKASRSVAENMSWQSMSEQYLQAYREVMKGV